jgi:hypothetical protein
MVNYLYDLDKVEANHAKFRQGEVVRSRSLGAALSPVVAGERTAQPSHPSQPPQPSRSDKTPITP